MRRARSKQLCRPMPRIGKVARFNPDTLAIAWTGKRIGDVLHMGVDEAVSLFATCP